MSQQTPQFRRVRNADPITHAHGLHSVDTAITTAAGGIEAIDPSMEHRYWREHYSSRPYVNEDDSYDDYGPAYQYGWESYGRHVGRTFDQVELDLAREWDKVKRRSHLSWERAKKAVCDAWNRVASREEKR